MKAIILTTPLLCLLALAQPGRAQSTTGGRSGGSTASTGTGYLTEGKRPAETSASSMTIADEGASRAYMYVPPTAAKNRSASPDGSGSPATSTKARAAQPASDKASSGKTSPRKRNAP